MSETLPGESLMNLLVKKGISHRQTAALFLLLLESKGILEPLKKGRTTYYLNHRLMSLILLTISHRVMNP